MGIEVSRVADTDLDHWDAAVDRASHAMPLHRSEALRTIARAADARLHPLLAEKGQRPVGLLPLFESSLGPLQVLRSPPTQLDIPYLGPVCIQFAELSTRKAEQWNRGLVDGCIEWMDETIAPDFVDIRTTDQYTDVRPFLWNDWDVTPSYTYIVDLSPGPEALLEQFSRDARRNITSPSPDQYEIVEGGEEAIERIIKQVRRRYEKQELSFGLPTELAVELYRQLPEGAVRPYVLRTDGEFRGGQLALDSGTTVYTWQAASTTSGDLPVNELVMWRAIYDACDRGRDRFDLVGAMLPRLCQYKSKYAPRPAPIYQIEHRSTPMQAASAVNRWLPERLSKLVPLG